MNIMVICIMLGVLLCTAILCIAMLSGLLARESDGRDDDRQRYEEELRRARRTVEVTHIVEYAQAARHFYDQEKESAAGARNTDDAQEK